MKAALAALLLAGAVAASAQDRVARDATGDTVTLTQKACAAEVLARIPAHAHRHFLAASADIGGQRYVCCWARRSDGLVVLQYEDGDAALIPWAEFKPVNHI